MSTLITIIHISMCVVLVLVVLLQVGKGANMGSLFGGSSQTIFGSSGPGTFLGKVTAGVAVVFMLTSLLLSHPSISRDSKKQEVAPVVNSVMPVQQGVPVPAAAPADPPLPTPGR